MIEFHLDSRSGVATYLQIVQQVKESLRLGTIDVGDHLAHRRQLVADAQHVQSQRLFDLLHNLQVGRDTRLGLQVKLDHRCLLTRTNYLPVSYLSIMIV